MVTDAEPTIAVAAPQPSEPPEAVAAPSEQEAPSKEETGAQEQEAPSEEETGAQDAGAQTLAQVREGTLARIEELSAGDPDMAAELAKRFGEKQPTVDDERIEWDLERGRQERGGRWQAAYSQYSQYTPERTQAQVTAIFTDLNEKVRQAVRDLAEEKIESEHLQIDPAGWAALITPLLQGGQTAMQQMVATGAQSMVMDALETHSSYRYLSADERQAMNQAVLSGKYGEAITKQLDAALRSAPEDERKRAKEAAQQEAGLLEKFLKAQEVLGKDGKRSASGGGTASMPLTLDQVNAALMDPMTPIEKLPELQKQREKLLGR